MYPTLADLVFPSKKNWPLVELLKISITLALLENDTNNCLCRQVSNLKKIAITVSNWLETFKLTGDYFLSINSNLYVRECLV